MLGELFIAFGVLFYYFYNLRYLENEKKKVYIEPTK